MLTQELLLSPPARIAEVLAEAADAYYNGSEPIMADGEYDELVERLRSLEPDHPFLKEVGATPEAGALAKAPHKIPMGSLNNLRDPEEFAKWYDKVGMPSVVIQDKLDGVSIELKYRDGKFTQAITRGDGFTGDDVTHTMRNASGVPQTISDGRDISVRGEAVLLIEAWKQFFADKKNPRNAVAGLVRRLDASGSEHINFIAFNVVQDGYVIEQDNEVNKMCYLQSLGFTVVESSHMAADGQVAVAAVLSAKEQARAELPFEVDGAVIKCNARTDQERLGEGSDMRPKWAMAYKFAPMGAHTQVIGTIHSLGTTGAITPVAEVVPVYVGGVTVSHVNLHNLDEVERLGLCVDDTVEVVRAGDVIPQIVRVVKPGDHRVSIEITACPICDGPVVKEGANTYCARKSECNGVKRQRVINWIKKRDIKYLGESTLDKLFEHGLLPEGIVSLYALTAANLEPVIGKAMSKKILSEIEKSRAVSVAELMGSLGIDLLGRTEAAKLVAAGLDTVGAFIDVTSGWLMDNVAGYKQTKARRVSDGVAAVAYEAGRLAEVLHVTEPQSEGILRGKSFCFTGKMKRSKKELGALVTDNGGEVKGSVTKDLDVLVMADPNSSSNKAKKARSYGTELLSEEEFMACLDMEGE